MYIWQVLKFEMYFSQKWLWNRPCTSRKHELNHFWERLFITVQIHIQCNVWDDETEYSLHLKMYNFFKCIYTRKNLFML